MYYTGVYGTCAGVFACIPGVSVDDFVEWVLASHPYSRCRRLNSGCQFCVQALLFAEPSHWPNLATFLGVKWIMSLKYIHLKISSMTSVFIRLKLKCGFIRGAVGFLSVTLVLEFWHCCSTVSYGTWVLELWPGWQGNEERTVTLRKTDTWTGKAGSGEWYAPWSHTF